MINCTITSPAKTEMHKKLQSITLPAFSGQIQILPGHAEAFILLQKGNIFLRQMNKQNKSIQITGGECYIKNDTITVVL